VNSGGAGARLLPESDGRDDSACALSFFLSKSFKVMIDGWIKGFVGSFVVEWLCPGIADQALLLVQKYNSVSFQSFRYREMNH
jgi:hypothetical protein